MGLRDIIPQERSIRSNLQVFKLRQSGEEVCRQRRQLVVRNVPVREMVA